MAYYTYESYHHLITVKELILQANLLRKLKKTGTVASYKRPITVNEQNMSVLVFSDAGRTCDHGQLCFIAGVLFGGLSEKSIFHTVS